MCESDIDRLPRMKDYMKPEDLNDEGVINLVAEVLRSMEEDLTAAARRAAYRPSDDNLQHLKLTRELYQTDWFATMTLGAVDGRQVAETIIRRALRGQKINIQKEGAEHEAVWVHHQVGWRP